MRPDAVGAWTFAVEAFSDPYLTWHDAVTKKIGAGQGLQDLGNDLAEGAALLEQAATGCRRPSGRRVRRRRRPCADATIPLFARISPALDLDRAAVAVSGARARDHGPRSCRSGVDRQRALFSAWYEFFPRSEGAVVDDARQAR